MLREDAQLAEKKYVLWTPLAREEFASKLFVLIKKLYVTYYGIECSKRRSILKIYQETAPNTIPIRE